MNVSRRWFIGGLAGALGTRPGRVFADMTGTFAQGRPELVFGVLSDVHICLQKGGKAFKKQYDVDTLIRAFAWFRDQGADAVVIAGDMAHSGLAGELKGVADAWFKVFPDDKAPDGCSVTRMFVFGNHDWSSPWRSKDVFPDEDERRSQLLFADPKKWWGECFHEDWTLFVRKEVKGYSFIGAHWCNGGCTGRNEVFTKGMKAYYAGQTFDPARPFFHIQHPQPKGTAHGDRVWGQDDGESTAILSAFPNAVAFSGHSHTSLLDEKAIWQGAFTSVGTATLRDVNPNLPGLFSPEGGFENYKSPKDPQFAATYEALKVMRHLDIFNCRQGQLVRVFTDRMVFSRREFVTGMSLGPDLVMPLPATQAKPFAFAPRLARAQAPAFPDGAKLRIKRGVGRTRKAKKGELVDVWDVSFPPANAREGVLPTSYEIRTKDAEGKNVVFGLLAFGTRFGPADPRTRKPLNFRVRCDRVAAEPKFEVCACSCWAKRSAPLVGIA